MPIPFHDTEEIDELGYAAFLHIEAASRGDERYGALLIVNARGEPVEFVYNKIALMHNLLWRSSEREQAVIRRLALTIFPTATLTPRLLFCRAGVVGPRLFGTAGDLSLEIPVGRIATAEEAVGTSGTEFRESLATSDADGVEKEIHTFWSPAKPEGTTADLFARLAERGLLLEPFERASLGLREVYGESAGTD